MSTRDRSADPMARHRPADRTAAMLGVIRATLRPPGTRLPCREIFRAVRLAGHWCTISQVSSLMSRHKDEFNPEGGWHLVAQESQPPSS